MNYNSDAKEYDSHKTLIYCTELSIDNLNWFTRNTIEHKAVKQHNWTQGCKTTLNWTNNETRL